MEDLVRPSARPAESRPPVRLSNRRRIARLSASALAATFAAAVAMTSIASADDFQDATAPQDDAGPAVARLATIVGNVSVQRGDSDEQVAATNNAPLLAADYLSTGDDGLAEVQFDGITLLRLDFNTQVRFADLDRGHREAQLAEGSIELRELRGADDHPQIDTPSVSVRPLGTGSYRVSVTPDGTTTVSVRSGSAQILTPAGPQTIEAYQSYSAQGPAQSPNVQQVAYLQNDGFDGWNNDRDGVEIAALDSADFNPAYDGDELASYGDWVDVPSYGRVWHPYEEAGWAPYHEGRWVWEDAYGWTWVADEPWGWAPYHYGRWFYDADYGGWLWTPPSYAPAYAASYAPPQVFWRPALVIFFGFGFGGGGSFSPSLGFGNVGWIPLGPNEIFRPWYGHGNGWQGGGYGNHYGNTTINNTTVNNTTINNVTNVTNINYGSITKTYANAGAPGGIASVNTRRFLQGNYHPSSVPVAQLQGASLGAFHGPLPLAPTKQNLAFSGHATPQTTTFRPIATQTTFAGHAPAPQRYSFENQRAEITTVLKAHDLPVEPKSFAAPTTAAGQSPETFHGPHPILAPETPAGRPPEPGSGLTTHSGENPTGTISNPTLRTGTPNVTPYDGKPATAPTNAPPHAYEPAGTISNPTIRGDKPPAAIPTPVPHPFKPDGTVSNPTQHPYDSNTVAQPAPHPFKPAGTVSNPTERSGASNAWNRYDAGHAATRSTGPSSQYQPNGYGARPEAPGGAATGAVPSRYATYPPVRPYATYPPYRSRPKTRSLATPPPRPN